MKLYGIWAILIICFLAAQESSAAISKVLQLEHSFKQVSAAAAVPSAPDGGILLPPDIPAPPPFDAPGFGMDDALRLEAEKTLTDAIDTALKASDKQALQAKWKKIKSFQKKLVLKAGIKGSAAPFTIDVNAALELLKTDLSKISSVKEAVNLNDKELVETVLPKLNEWLRAKPNFFDEKQGQLKTAMTAVQDIEKKWRAAADKKSVAQRYKSELDDKVLKLQLFIDDYDKVSFEASLKDLRSKDSAFANKYQEKISPFPDGMSIGDALFTKCMKKLGMTKWIPTEQLCEKRAVELPYLKEFEDKAKSLKSGITEFFKKVNNLKTDMDFVLSAASEPTAADLVIIKAKEAERQKKREEEKKEEEEFIKRYKKDFDYLLEHGVTSERQFDSVDDEQVEETLNSMRTNAKGYQDFKKYFGVYVKNMFNAALQNKIILSEVEKLFRIENDTAFSKLGNVEKPSKKDEEVYGEWRNTPQGAQAFNAFIRGPLGKDFALKEYHKLQKLGVL